MPTSRIAVLVTLLLPLAVAGCARSTDSMEAIQAEFDKHYETTVTRLPGVVTDIRVTRFQNLESPFYFVTCGGQEFITEYGANLRNLKVHDRVTVVIHANVPKTPGLRLTGSFQVYLDDPDQAPF